MNFDDIDWTEDLPTPVRTVQLAACCMRRRSSPRPAAAAGRVAAHAAAAAARRTAAHLQSAGSSFACSAAGWFAPAGGA